METKNKLLRIIMEIKKENKLLKTENKNLKKWLKVWQDRYMACQGHKEDVDKELADLKEDYKMLLKYKTK